MTSFLTRFVFRLGSKVYRSESLPDYHRQCTPEGARVGLPYTAAAQHACVDALPIFPFIGKRRVLVFPFSDITVAAAFKKKK
jgi:hypothetical protein